jgi:hypothetical protein
MNDVQNLLSEIKLATDYQTNREILREKVLTDLHLTYNNGMFRVTPELLAFVATWELDVLYLEDEFHNPIEVQRSEFLEQARQCYHKVMNRWHQQHAELRKIRKI